MALEEGAASLVLEQLAAMVDLHSDTMVSTVPGRSSCAVSLLQSLVFASGATKTRSYKAEPCCGTHGSGDLAKVTASQESSWRLCCLHLTS